MTFIEHLTELRGRVVKGLIAVTAFSVLGYIFKGTVLEILRRPLGDAVPLHAFDLFGPSKVRNEHLSADAVPPL